MSICVIIAFLLSLICCRCQAGLSFNLETRHGYFRERGLLQKRSGTLGIEGSVKEVG